MWGTLATLDALGQVQDSIYSYGEENLATHVANAMSVHNTLMQEMIADFPIVTSDRQIAYGSGDDFVMQELDQMGSPDAQKPTAAGALGLPLRFYGTAVQWNRHYMLNTSVASFVSTLNGMAVADVKNVIRQIRRALMKPTNTLNYADILTAKNNMALTYNLYALLNADSMAIPNAPSGASFDPTSHSHYNASATFTEASLRALIDDVVEHGVSGSIAVYINRTEDAAVRTFGAFRPYLESGERPSADTAYAEGTLGNDPTDRAIGTFDGAEIVVKNLVVPPSYQIAFDRGAGQDKALAIRTRSGQLSGDAYHGGFGLLAEDENHPLRAQSMGREFGVGVKGRHKAAVNFSGGATYTMPAAL